MALLGQVYRKTCLVLFAVFGLPVLYLVEPFYRLRFRDMFQDRIGNFAANNDIEIRKRRLEGAPPRTLFVYFLWNPANRQLADMWKRCLCVIENRWIASAHFGIKPLLAKTRFQNRPPKPESEHRVISLGRATLQFTESEKEKGGKLLAEMGIGPDDWFVCLHSRDNAYLMRRAGYSVRGVKDEYRNCPIENYFLAARWIAERGGYVVRMGALVEGPLPDLGPRIIDYATKFRSDFMDIYLSGTCALFLGSSSGLMSVPVCFDRPVAQANKVPLTSSGFGTKQLFIPKLLRKLDTGALLTYPEAHALGLFDTSTPERWSWCEAAGTYPGLGLEWIDNTPEDILDLSKDMFDMIDGHAVDPEAARLQEVYRKFHCGPQASEYSSRVGPRFALKYRELIEPIIR